MKNLINRNKLDKSLNDNKFSLLDLIIWICLAFSISLVMLLICATTANAQTSVGCTDYLADNYNPSVMVSSPSECVFLDASEINFFGFNTTAIANIMTPTISTFNVKKLIVKYKEVGANGWTTIKLKIDEETFNHSGRIDTLGISFWYFNAQVGDCIDNGNRYSVYVRLNNLNTNTDYKVRMKFKGQSLIGGSNKTTVRVATDNTKSFMYEAPYTTNNPTYN